MTCNPNFTISNSTTPAGTSTADPDGAAISDMLLVEHRTFYLDLTMHLRAAPRPGERYRLEVVLVRDEEILDRRTQEFDLVFVEPDI